MQNNISRRQFLGLSAGVAAVLGLGLVGCGGGSSTSSSEAAVAAVSGGVEAVKSRGTLNVGVKKDVPGYGYLDPATNTYTGLEIDLSYAVAAKIFDCTADEAKERKLCSFTDVTPKTRGPLIDNGTLDMVAATYTITDERKKSWDFSTPYREDSVGLLIKKSSGMTKLEDLDGKVIGVSQGSTTKDNITKMLSEKGISATPTFQDFADYPSLKAALDSGNIDVFSVDRSILGGYIDDTTELLAADTKFGTQEYGVSTAMGSDLGALVSSVIDELKSSGELDKMIASYNLL